MATLERTYTIPLRRETIKTPRYKRAKKAIAALKQFGERHLKTTDIKLGKYLNMKVWENGIKNTPHSVKVTAVKDDKGTATMELFGAPKEEKKETAKKEKATESKKTEKTETIKDAEILSESKGEETKKETKTGKTPAETQKQAGKEEKTAKAESKAKQ